MISPAMLDESTCWKVSGVRSEPEVCTHVHFYRGQEALVQWFDAFLDALLVSKSVARERVEQFASVTGGALSGGAA